MRLSSFPPSDHVIKPADAFARAVIQAEAIAKAGYIVTFGIKPAKPETGYGYIKAGARGEDQWRRVFQGGRVCGKARSCYRNPVRQGRQLLLEFRDVCV